MEKPVVILLVEDNPGDVRLTFEAMRDSRISNEIAVVRDGEEALRYLRQQAEYVDATRPDLVLLDLNLPKLDGREVLRQVKADEDLRTIPVVVLTSSQAEADILQSYALAANSYITKPVGFPDFVKAMHTIEDFWFALVSLPTSRRESQGPSPPRLGQPE